MPIYISRELDDEFQSDALGRQADLTREAIAAAPPPIDTTPPPAPPPADPVPASTPPPLAPAASGPPALGDLLASAGLTDLVGTVGSAAGSAASAAGSAIGGAASALGGAAQNTVQMASGPPPLSDLMQQAGLGDVGATRANSAAGSFASATSSASAPPALSDLLSQAGLAGQQATNAITQKVDQVQQAVQSVAAPAQRISQFESGLSDADAYAACGPVAAVAFAQANGRNPTAQEALDLAKKVGWMQGAGMAGVASEQQLLKEMGIPAHLESNVDWQHVAQDASSGNPVIISTPGHYYVVDGYNPQTGQFHQATRAERDLKGGSEWMSAGDMQRLMGQANGALYADNPNSPSPSVAAVQSQQGPAQKAIATVLGAPRSVADMIDQAASQEGVAPALLAAVVKQESRFSQTRDDGTLLTSPAGALGLSQLEPGTARALGVDPSDPLQNLIGGARYLKQLLGQFGGDVTKAIAAYNAGPGAVQRFDGIPPYQETQAYVQNVTSNLAQLGQNVQTVVAQAAQGAGNAVSGAVQGAQQNARGLLSNATALVNQGQGLIDQANGNVQSLADYTRGKLAPINAEADRLTAANQQASDQTLQANQAAQDQRSIAASLSPSAPVTAPLSMQPAADQAKPLWQSIGDSIASALRPLVEAVQGGTTSPAPPPPGPQRLQPTSAAPAGPASMGRTPVGAPLVAPAGMALPTVPAAAPSAPSSPPSLFDQVRNAVGTATGRLGDAITAAAGNLPPIDLSAPAANTPLGKEVRGQPVTPLEQLQAVPPLFQGAEAARVQAVQNLNPTRDVPVVGGAVNLIASAATDPVTYLAGGPIDAAVNGALARLLPDAAPRVVQAAAQHAMTGFGWGVTQGAEAPDATPQSVLESGIQGAALNLGAVGVAGATRELRDALSTPAVTQFLTARQPAQADVNFASGGLAGILQRLSGYPAETRQGLEDFVQAQSAAGHSLEDVGNTVINWMRDNPPPAPESAGRLGGQVQIGNGDTSQLSWDAQFFLEGFGGDRQATIAALNRELANMPAGDPSIPGIRAARDELVAAGGSQPPVTPSRGVPLGGSEALGPSGPQRGQLGFESTLPYGGPPPPAGSPEGPATPQRGQLQFESQLPVGGPRPTGTESSGPAGRQPGQIDLPGVSAPTDIHPRIQQLLGNRPEYAQIAQDGLNELTAAHADPATVARYFAGVERSAGLPSGVDANAWFRSLRNGAMAGGLQTLGHVLLNVPMQVLWSVPREVVAATLRGQPEQIPASVVGLFKGFEAGAEAALQQLRYGITAADAAAGGRAIGATSAARTALPPIIGLRTDSGAAQLGANLLSGLVGTHGAAQTLVQRIGFFQKATQLAWTQAKGEGLHGSQFSARVSDILSNLTDPQWANIASEAQNYGDRMALRGAQGKLGSALQKVAAAGPAGNLLIPFESIANHVLTGGIESTPGVGALGLGLDVAARARGAGPYAAGATDVARGAVTPISERAANQILGTGVFAMGLSLAGAGVLVGDGPSNPQERATALDSGQQFDGIRLGNVFVPGHMLGRLWYPLAAAANVVEAQKYAKQGATAEQMIADGIQRTGTFFSNETFLRQFADLAAALKDPSGKTLESFTAQLAQSFIPQAAALRDIGTVLDPTARVPATTGDFGQDVGSRIAAQMPILRSSQPPRIEATTGEAAPNRSGWLGSVLHPPAPDDPVAQEALRLEIAGYPVGLAQPKANYLGVQQTPEALTTIQTAAGQAVKLYASNVINDPKYANLSDPQKADALKQALTQANEATKIGLGNSVARDPHESALWQWASTPQYAGVSSKLPPEEIARQNWMISEAKSKLAAYTKAYGDRALSQLRRDDPQAFKLSQRDRLDTEILNKRKAAIDKATGGALNQTAEKASSGGLVGVSASVLPASPPRLAVATAAPAGQPVAAGVSGGTAGLPSTPPMLSATDQFRARQNADIRAAQTKLATYRQLYGDQAETRLRADDPQAWVLSRQSQI